MKNIYAYYALICIPLAALVLMANYGMVSSLSFTILILTYGIIYHPLISGLRLVSLNVIRKDDFSKNFIPLWNLKFFKQLFITS